MSVYPGKKNLIWPFAYLGRLFACDLDVSQTKEHVENSPEGTHSTVPNLTRLLLVLVSCRALSNIALGDEKIRLAQNRLSVNDKRYVIDTAGKTP